MKVSSSEIIVKNNLRYKNGTKMRVGINIVTDDSWSDPDNQTLELMYAASSLMPGVSGSIMGPLEGETLGLSCDFTGFTSIDII